VLKHQPTTIDRIVVLAVSPITVNFLVLAATTALLDMEVIALVVEVHGPPASVAPDDGQVTAVYFDPHEFTFGTDL
jgi:hypothetical protein